MSSSDLTFWEHLDVLRGSLIRCLVAVFSCAIVAFVLKEQIFDLVLWPQKADFPTYRLLDSLSSTFDLRLLTNVSLPLMEI